MKVRLATAATLVGALALSISGAEAAATPTLDGKKVKVLTLTATAAVQDHDSDQVTTLVNDSDPTQCVAPACSRLTFTYKPAKGVKGDLMLTSTWTNPAADIDLYFAEVLKDGSSAEIANCASAGGPSEKIFVEASALKPGKKYALIAFFFRTANETVNTKVEIAVPNSIKTSVPAAADELADANCTL